MSVQKPRRKSEKRSDGAKGESARKRKAEARERTKRRGTESTCVTQHTCDNAQARKRTQRFTRESRKKVHARASEKKRQRTVRKHTRASERKTKRKVRKYTREKTHT